MSRDNRGVVERGEAVLEILRSGHDPPDLGFLATASRLLRVWREQWRLVAIGLAVATGTRPWRRDGSGPGVIALVSGAVDAAANVCYVLATRAGLFGLAVVITALYPGMTVLLARWVLGERMRWLQRAGLLLAAAGVVLLTT